MLTEFIVALVATHSKYNISKQMIAHTTSPTILEQTLEYELEKNPNNINTLWKVSEYLHKRLENVGLLELRIDTLTVASTYHRLVNRLIATIAKLENITEDEFVRLCSLRFLLHHFILASGNRNGDWSKSLFCTNISLEKDQFNYSLPTKKLKLFALVCSDSAFINIYPKLSVAVSNNELFALLISRLAQRSRAEVSVVYEDFLLGELLKVDVSSITKVNNQNIYHGWMYLSYFSNKKKYEARKKLNEVICKVYLQNKGHLPLTNQNKANPRKLIVIAERWRSTHALFRFFGNTVKDLSNEYETILVTTPENYDSESIRHFKKVIHVEPSGDTLEQIKQISAEKPGAIFYPSIGMEFWCIKLSNQRIAPIQISGQGHPGPGRIDSIDAVIIGSNNTEIAKAYSERYIFLRTYSAVDPAASLAPHPDLLRYMSERSEQGKCDNWEINIAITARTMKIDKLFTDVLETIRIKSTKRIVYHFFIGDVGYQFDAVGMQLKRKFPNDRYHSRLSYYELLESIDRCQLCLHPLTFGNANGVVDAIILGKPSIGLIGDDLPGLSTKAIYDLFGINTNCISPTSDDYINRALELISSWERYSEEARKIKNASLTYMQKLVDARPEKNESYIKFFRYILSKSPPHKEREILQFDQ